MTKINEFKKYISSVLENKLIDDVKIINPKGTNQINVYFIKNVDALNLKNAFHKEGIEHSDIKYCNKKKRAYVIINF